MRTIFDLQSNRRYSAFEIGVSLLLAAFVLNGLLVVYTPMSKSITRTIMDNLFVITIVYFLVALVLFIIIRTVFRYVDSIDEDETIRCDNKFSLKECGFFSLIVFLFWSPYLILCYPTITRGYDFFWQLLQGLGIFPLSNHHPIFSSYIFAILFRIGYTFGNASTGLFVISLVQTMIMAFSLGFGLSVIRTITRIPKGIVTIMICFVGLCPIFPTHAVWAIKDSIFSSVATILFIQVFLYIYSKQNGIKVPVIASLPLILLMGILFSLYRNGVLPIVLLLFAVTFCSVWSYDGKILKKCIGFSVAFIVVLFLWNQFLEKNDVYPTNLRESLSLPANQIMRTIQLHPNVLEDDLTADTLGDVYYERVGNGEEIESIVEKYDSIIFDTIKVDYIKDKTVLIDYLKLWMKIGIKHPGSYYDALIRGSNRYWDPFVKPYVILNGKRLSSEAPTDSPEKDFANEALIEATLSTANASVKKSLQQKDFDLNMKYGDLFDDYQVLRELMETKSAFPEGRNILNSIVLFVEETPVLSRTMIPAFYLFLLMISFAYLFSRKKTGRYLWPVMLIEVLAILSPVNGYMRYVLPLCLLSIIISGTCFEPEKK